MKDRRHANHRTGWLCGAISFYPCSCSASCWILGVNSSAWWGESKAQTVFGLVMKIRGLSKYRGRNPHGYFHDLPWKVRQRAYAWLSRFLKRHPYCLALRDPGGAGETAGADVR